MERKKLIECRGNKSRSDVASDLGVTPQMLGAIERGDRNPSLTLAKKISDYYKLAIEDIFFNQKGNESFLNRNEKEEVV
ncbi:helix-turn-helix transcriptional regulator [Halobacillus litoralis]|uniref:helix-turn-helix transcriptional regulator n=1 Tax=Halobacillus litoralis TaxID=45668 RepID=UPI001CD62DF1|nr:helix-turn-helix domain-containing protein [Halobacillus litoralis]MCA1021823.1 helix-turn-helix domain-containing protein [Halobacillus litoralis]